MAQFLFNRFRYDTDRITRANLGGRSWQKVQILVRVKSKNDQLDTILTRGEEE